MGINLVTSRSLFSAALFLFMCSLAAQPIFGQEQEEATQGSLEERADAAQIRAQIALAEKLLDKAPDRGAVLYFLAVAHAQLRETLEALANLKECTS